MVRTPAAIRAQRNDDAVMGAARPARRMAFERRPVVLYGATICVRRRIASRIDAPESSSRCLTYFVPESRELRRLVVELAGVAQRPASSAM
jgi:hypothetical protein